MLVEYMGDSTTLGIDPKTGHILMITYRGKAPMTGSPGTIVNIYSDFKEVDGLVYPMSTMGTFEGKPSMSVTITSMGVDGPLDETAFVMPESATTSGGR